MFNKIDSLKEEEIVLLKKEQDNRNCIFVSSLKKKDMAHLKEKIWEVLKTRKRIYQWKNKDRTNKRVNRL